jgi:3-hydroxyacyl-[acyl-carrier-protein] dehydratase
MILLNDFFFMIHQKLASDSVQAKISINPHHKIFEGHFPRMPIVPGVCMVQVILEIMETVAGKPVRLTEADTIKFLAMMNPEENKEIDVLINYADEQGRVLINANLFSGSIIFFKLKGALTIG